MGVFFFFPSSFLLIILFGLIQLYSLAKTLLCRMRLWTVNAKLWSPWIPFLFPVMRAGYSYRFLIILSTTTSHSGCALFVSWWFAQREIRHLFIEQTFGSTTNLCHITLYNRGHIPLYECKERTGWKEGEKMNFQTSLVSYKRAWC